MKIVILIVFSLLAGCATQGIGPPSPSETGGLIIAEKSQVAGCTFLGDVHGVSPLYGTHAAIGLRKARAAALNEAKKIGATHIVWQEFMTPHGSTSVHGYAYRCSR